MAFSSTPSRVLTHLCPHNAFHRCRNLFTLTLHEGTSIDHDDVVIPDGGYTISIFISRRELYGRARDAYIALRSD